MGSVCKLAKSETLALRPIVVEILAPLLPLPKGRETGYLENVCKKRRRGSRLERKAGRKC